MKPKGKKYPVLDDKSAFPSRIMVPNLARKCLSTHSAISGIHHTEEVPMGAKLAMVPGNTLRKLYTADCGDKLQKSSFDFDLTFSNHDEYITNEYKCLHDPHLSDYFQNNKRMVKHLQKRGFITGDSKVICSLKEYNAYRQYLKLISVEDHNKTAKEMHEKEVRKQKRLEKRAIEKRKKDPNDPTNIRINRCKSNRLKIEKEKREQAKRIISEAEEEKRRRERLAKREKRVKSVTEMQRELSREKMEKEKYLQKEKENSLKQEIMDQKRREDKYRIKKHQAIQKQKSIEKQFQKEEKFESMKAFEIINRFLIKILLEEEGITRSNSVHNLHNYFQEKWEAQQKKLRSRIEKERKAQEEKNFQIEESLKKRGWTGPPRKPHLDRGASVEDTSSSKSSETNKTNKGKAKRKSKKLQQPPMVF